MPQEGTENMKEVKEYKVKYADDKGSAYTIKAASPWQAAKQLVNLSPCSPDAMVIVSLHLEEEPYVYSVEELL